METPVCGISTRAFRSQSLAERGVGLTLSVTVCMLLKRSRIWLATTWPVRPRAARSGGTENASTTRPSARLACQAMSARPAASATPANADSAFSATPERRSAISQPTRRRCASISRMAASPGARPLTSAAIAISIGSGVVGAASAAAGRRRLLVPWPTIRARPPSVW
jgi:hypothetical protein